MLKIRDLLGKNTAEDLTFEEREQLIKFFKSNNTAWGYFLEGLEEAYYQEWITILFSDKYHDNEDLLDFVSFTGKMPLAILEAEFYTFNDFIPPLIIATYYLALISLLYTFSYYLQLFYFML